MIVFYWFLYKSKQASSSLPCLFIFHGFYPYPLITYLPNWLHHNLLFKTSNTRCPNHLWCCVRLFFWCGSYGSLVVSWCFRLYRILRGLYIFFFIIKFVGSEPWVMVLWWLVSFFLWFSDRICLFCVWICVVL